LLPEIVSYIGLDPRARTAFELGDRELAARVRHDLEGFEGTLLGSDTFVEGAAEHALGLIAHVEGDHDRAITLLEYSLEVDESHEFHALAARHRIELARVLLARANADDTERAAGLLREAAEAAEALGMPVVERMARELLAG
jgi:hypothetical protein